jgi:hypothetical protein
VPQMTAVRGRMRFKVRTPDCGWKVPMLGYPNSWSLPLPYGHLVRTSS